MQFIDVSALAFEVRIASKLLNVDGMLLYFIAIRAAVKTQNEMKWFFKLPNF